MLSGNSRQNHELSWAREWDLWRLSRTHSASMLLLVAHEFQRFQAVRSPDLALRGDRFVAVVMAYLATILAIHIQLYFTGVLFFTAS